MLCGSCFIIGFYLYSISIGTGSAINEIEEMRIWEFLDFMKWFCQNTTHECIGIHEFTNKYFKFHEFTNDILSFHDSRTTSFSRIHERFFWFSRIHERKKANSRLHERRWGASLNNSIKFIPRNSLWPCMRCLSQSRCHSATDYS